MGFLKDRTGDYTLGLRLLAGLMILGGILVLRLRARPLDARAKLATEAEKPSPAAL
jgi:hypothetical protein